MKQDTQKLHTFTTTIADVEPFVFTIPLEEEPVFRKAAFHVNQYWRQMKDSQPDKSSHYALAKVALAFAELYYRKSEQLASQSKILEDFEKDLDEILMVMD